MTIADVLALGPWTADHVLVISPTVDFDDVTAFMSALAQQAALLNSEMPLIIVAPLDGLALLDEGTMRVSGWVRAK